MGLHSSQRVNKQESRPKLKINGILRKITLKCSVHLQLQEQLKETFRVEMPIRQKLFHAFTEIVESLLNDRLSE